MVFRSKAIFIEMYLSTYRYFLQGVFVVNDINYDYKVWLKYRGKPLIGEGRYLLLKNIKKTKSLKKSAQNLGLSNKTAYNYIKKVENRLSKKIICSHKGGKDAGGYTELTLVGEELIKRYEESIEKIK